MRLQEFVEYLDRLEEEEKEKKAREEARGETGRCKAAAADQRGGDAKPRPGPFRPSKSSEGKMRVLEQLRALKFNEDEEIPCLDPDEEAGERVAEEEEDPD